MYHKNMTIKRRLFISNIRMGILTIATFMLIIRALTYFFYDESKPDLKTILQPGEHQGDMIRIVIFLLGLAFVIILLSVINNFFTNRMTKRIAKPLEALSEGVRQIGNNNLAYRIEYQDNDEFRPVCEAFNVMVDRLQDSAAQRLKDESNRRELLAGISHDLRTPLTTISGYLDGLESGVASTPEMRNKYFDTIKNRTKEMRHIIEQLFLFSKLDMDDFTFTPHRFYIMRALSDMIEELAEEYSMRGLTITIAGLKTEVSPRNLFVYADVSQLRRVVINILENSAKYKENEIGHLEINAAFDNNFVWLKFADDGPGVDPEALPHIFNAFYRTDPSRHSKGSGLGLAISAKIIERSGGTIYAENGVSGGLVVVVCLPIETGAG